jgi:DNA-binding FadR family transcriptional regulator
MTQGHSHLYNKAEYTASQNPIQTPGSPDIGQPIGTATLRNLRLWLAANHPKPGSRLPPERHLATTLAISRPELRKALMILEVEGRITRHVGRGTFVSTPPKLALTGSAITAIADRTSPHEAMIARLTLEPQLAHLAALHASPRQITQAQQLSHDIRATTNWDDYENLDHQLHDIIAEAAGNALLHELHKIMNTVRQTVVWRQLSPGRAGPQPDYHSFDEHDAIIDAIARRDRNGAKSAMHKHLTSTLNAMTSSDT